MLEPKGTFLHNGAGTADDEKKWIMCPVCYEPNSPDRSFCKYCSGTKITKLEQGPLRSLSEIDRLRKEWVSRRRKIRILKRSITLSVSVIAVVALTVTILFYFTDVIGAPKVTLSSNSAPGEWTMFRHDVAGTSRYGENSTAPEGVLKWQFKTGSFIEASPSVADGRVYIGSTDNHLYALDIETGEPLWSFQAESWFESSAAVHDGVVYVGSNDSNLYALDAETGEKIWVYRAKYGIRSSPAVAGGRVYFASGEYMVYAVDAQTGELEWQHETEGHVLASPVVHNGLLFVGDSDSYFYVLDAITGRLRLKFDAYGNTRGSAVVAGDRAYFASTRGYLFCIDSMARSWPNEHPTRNFLLKFYLQSLSIVPPDWLIPPRQTGYLWALKLDGVTYSSPVIDKETLYVGSSNKLVAVDLSSHEKTWVFTGGDTIRSSPALAGGVLFVGCNDGNLYAVDADSGNKLWEYETGAPVVSSPAVADGVVYIASANGIVYAIE